MNLLDFYLAASVVFLIAFGIMFKGLAPLPNLAVKVAVNLTALAGAALLIGRLGWIG